MKLITTNIDINYIIKKREFYLFIVVMLISITLSFLSSGFLSYNNFIAISANESMKGVVIIGMTLLLITRVFDLSLGAVMALSGVASAYLLSSGVSIILSIIGGLLTGCITGLINGYLVTKLKINSLITTLGMMYMARGMALVITKGTPISHFPENFIKLGQIHWLGIPLSLYILSVIGIVVVFLLRKNIFFVKLFYVGSNEKAANFVGINPDYYRMLTFIMAGLFAGFAGVILTAKMRTAIPTSFEGLELRLIAASIIGGASLKGGQGSIIGSILGLLILILIGNAMTILSISVYWEGVVLGTVLILAAIFDVWSKRVID